MTCALAPFTFALLQALGIHARILGRDSLSLRPQFTSKAVLGRLRTGIRALEAYLRRVLILMALAMEPDLVVVERPENLARAKAKMPRVKKHVFTVYPADAPGGQVYFERLLPLDRGAREARKDATTPPDMVPIGAWLSRLDYLHALAKDPIAKARRLAFSLARGRHGFLMAPPTRPRLLSRWGTEASAIHDAMAVQIIQKSHSRPPPLPPPRRGPKPTITVFW